MNGLRSIRALSADSLRGVTPAKVNPTIPTFEWVDPRDIFIEETYQRDIRESGTNLIRRIVSKFSWARFKPPICVRLEDSDNILVCIDGQHSATAAASHPGVPKIPVMIIDAADMAARASSFVGHNRDRLNLTQMAIYHAEVAAGEPSTALVERACSAAGVTVARKPFTPSRPARTGDTVAIGTIKMIGRKHGEELLTRVLKVLVAAGRAPIKADELSATTTVLLNDPGARLDDRLARAIGSKADHVWSSKAIVNAQSSGRVLPTELADMWTRAAKGQPEREPLSKRPLEPSPEPRQQQPAPSYAPKPQAAPPRPPAPPATVQMPDQPAAQQVVAYFGVSLDLKMRRVTHRGREDQICDDGIRLVAALARVMPAFLPTDIVARKVFGSIADSDFKVRGLAERTNPILLGIRLEARPVDKLGWMLRDLDATAAKIDAD